MEQSEKNEGQDFASLAKQPRPGVVSELAAFLKQNRKWWLVPVVLSLVLLGVLIFIGSTAAAPFIYTLF